MRAMQPLFPPAPIALAAALALATPLLAAAQPAASGNAGTPGVGTPAAGVPTASSQPLGAALGELSAATGTPIGFAPALVTGKTARTFSAGVTTRQALDQLLAGTGLIAVPEGRGFIIKAAPAAGETAALGTVTVTAQANRDGTTEGTGSYTQTGPTRTATGLSLTLRETPQSVSVMTRQRMDDFKLETLADVMEQTPGIAVYRQGNATDFQARGTSVNLQTDGMAQVSSGWYYLTSTLFSLDDMAEIDRIEVLKGSSGLVVGKGNYGATVNMIRKRPTREFQASARASAGSWDTYRAQADISGPLNEAGTLRGRLVASAMDAGSFRDYEKSNSQMLFGALEADLSPDTQLNVGMTYRQREASGIGTTQPIQRYTRAGAEVPWMPRSFNAGAPWGGYEQETLNLFGSLEQRLAHDWKAELKFSHQRATMDDMKAGYFYDQDRASFGRWADMNNDNWSVNLDVHGPFTLWGRTHELLAGAGISRFSGSAKLPLNPLSLVPLADLGVRFAQGGAALREPDYGNLNWGDNSFNQKQRYVYAAGRFQLGDPLQLIAGLRVTTFEELDTTPYWWNSDMKDSGVLTPYAGLVYELNRNVSLYGSYANIFQPQTSLTEQGTALPPEKGNTFELGAKGEFLDRRLNASLALYWMKTRNTGEETGGLTPGGDTAYRAVSSATRHGWELEMSGELARGWQAQGSVVQQNSSLNGATAYPEYQLKLGTTYRFQQGALSGLTVGAATRWQGKTSVSNAAATLAQEGYALLDLMARYQVDRHLSFSINVNNATDRKYLAGMTNFSAAGLFYTWGAPRSVNVGVRYDY
ncbi:TonB-dependent siderophore receptor [Comamonas antarctica]|uniref:TonB-dependent siderophore receptor n=1 Tax=Comamonas antarctica TaxID=2743470 RepID=UPI0028EE5EE5|nr:TonB-dependent siderophore receptor [Comamonas antarctica]